MMGFGMICLSCLRDARRVDQPMLSEASLLVYCLAFNCSINGSYFLFVRARPAFSRVLNRRLSKMSGQARKLIN